MTELFKLRAAYQKQHTAMCSKGSQVIYTNRRQKCFRPRGEVYRRMLMLELNKVPVLAISNKK